MARTHTQSETMRVCGSVAVSGVPYDGKLDRWWVVKLINKVLWFVGSCEEQETAEKLAEDCPADAFVLDTMW